MNIFGREAGDKPKKPLQLVQRGTDTRIPLELVAQPSGEVLDLTRFERLNVKIFNELGTECATPPTDIQDNHLIVEVTADISQALGTGIYSVEVTGRVSDTTFADGYHDYTVRTTLCRVTSDGSDATPTKVTANVIEGLRGLSAYEIAVKHGYTGTEEEWAKSLVGNDGADAYEVAKKAGYTGSREEWLKTLIGANGLSAYELAKAEGYEGSLTEWLASLKGTKGDDGDNAYQVAVRNGYVGDEQTWLASLKGDKDEASNTPQVIRIGGKDVPISDYLLRTEMDVPHLLLGLAQTLRVVSDALCNMTDDTLKEVVGRKELTAESDDDLDASYVFRADDKKEPWANVLSGYLYSRKRKLFADQRLAEEIMDTMRFALYNIMKLEKKRIDRVSQVQRDVDSNHSILSQLSDRIDYAFTAIAKLRVKAGYDPDDERWKWGGEPD